jgi:hypothetical protein
MHIEYAYAGKSCLGGSLIWKVPHAATVYRSILCGHGHLDREDGLDRGLLQTGLLVHHHLPHLHILCLSLSQGTGKDDQVHWKAEDSETLSMFAPVYISKF